MASTFSNLGFELQTTGENANTWGDKTNVNIKLIDERLSAIGLITNTSDFDLPAPSNATESVNNGAATLKFTGSLSGLLTVTMPAKTLLYNVVNATSGGQDIKFKCSTQTTTATIKNGQNGVIHSDGSANVYLISTVANDFDDDVTITTGDGALLTLRSSHDTIDDGDVLGALQFRASAETGADALAVAASIIAEADDEFDADSAATDFVFKLGTTVASDDTAIERMRLTHEGDLNLVTDGKSINFGADSEIQLTHVADTGLTLTHTATGASKPVVLNLKSEEDEIVDGDVIGKITFTAGDSDGTDAIATAASIEAVSQTTFATDANATKLVFKTGTSEAATAKAQINNTGSFSILTDGQDLSFGADGDVKLTHVHDTGLLLNSTRQLQFGDSGTYIHQSEDGVLDLVSDTEIEINATTIDMNGALDVSGAIVAGGDITAFSDERLKSDVKTIDNALDKVMNMRGVSYTKQAEKGVGVIAQEIEKVLPEVVTDGEYKSVAYGNIVGVLIEAIKELKTEIDTHKQGCKCHDVTT